MGPRTNSKIDLAKSSKKGELLGNSKVPDQKSAAAKVMQLSNREKVGQFRTKVSIICEYLKKYKSPG